MDVLSIIEILGALALFAGGLGYLVQAFKGGSRVENKEITSSAEKLSSFWKEQVEGYQKVLEQKDARSAQRETEWNTKFTELTREVGTIKGQLVEKEKQAEHYLAILQNRDPETKQFMELMIKFAENQTTINGKMIGVLNDIHTMTKAEHDRDFKIEATVTKQS